MVLTCNKVHKSFLDLAVILFLANGCIGIYKNSHCLYVSNINEENR